MIIFPIDDVHDLKLGKSVKLYNSRKTAGTITNIYRRLPSMAPFVTIGSIHCLVNGFLFYDGVMINKYMINHQKIPSTRE